MTINLCKISSLLILLSPMLCKLVLFLIKGTNLLLYIKRTLKMSCFCVKIYFFAPFQSNFIRILFDIEEYLSIYVLKCEKVQTAKYKYLKWKSDGIMRWFLANSQHNFETHENFEGHCPKGSSSCIIIFISLQIIEWGGS